MKDKFCVINYNTLNNNWYIYLKTAQLSHFLSVKTSSKAIVVAKRLALRYKTVLYINDKDNVLVEKRDYCFKVKI